MLILQEIITDFAMLINGEPGNMKNRLSAFLSAVAAGMIAAFAHSFIA